MPGARVEIRDLRKSFEHAGRSIDVLCGLDVVLEAGEMVAVVVAVGAFDWGTLIVSNGMRFVVILLVTVVTAGLSFPIHGAMPARTEPGPSPDLLGVDRPLTASDILEADVALDIDEGMFHGAA